MAAQQGNRKVDRIFDEAYLEGLRSWPHDTLGQKRAECLALEEEVSYNRRLLQGKLDILTHAQQARAAGPVPTTAQLVQDLPAILSEQSAQAGQGRHLSLEVPPEPSAARRLEDALTGFQDFQAMSEEDLSAAVQRLAEGQNKLSEQRKRLHAIIGQLDEELVKRHQAAEPITRG